MIQFRHIILNPRAEALLGALIAAQAEGDRTSVLVDEAIGRTGLRFQPALAGGDHQAAELMALERQGLVDLAAAGRQHWRLAVTRTGREYFADACDFPPAPAPDRQTASQGSRDAFGPAAGPPADAVP